MAESSFIWDSGGGGDASPHSEADTAAIFAATVSRGSGVLRGYLNSLAVTAAGGTSSPLTIATGWAMVDGHPYRNSTAATLAITTPSIGTTGHRIVLRATWSAQTVRIADVASADGTAAIPAATQTSGTTYEITLATLTITTGGVVTVTDAREYPPLELLSRIIGRSDTPVATTSTSPVDMITISGLSIPATSKLRILVGYSKDALAAQPCAFNLKLNASIVIGSLAVLSGTNQVEEGVMEFMAGPRTAAISNAVIGSYASRVTATGVSQIATTPIDSINNTMPTVAITSIALGGVNTISNNNFTIEWYRIWEDI